MNTWCFTGYVTSDADFVETMHGAQLRFHVHIKTRTRRRRRDDDGSVVDVWSHVSIFGREAIKVVDDIWMGQTVTVEGTVEGCGDRPGPIYVLARNVIPHILDDESEELE